MKIRIVADGSRDNAPGTDEGVWVSERIEGGWVAHARIEVRFDRPTVAELRIVPAPNPPPGQKGITRKVTDRVPLGAFGPYLLAASSFYGSDLIKGTRKHLAGPLFRRLEKLAGLASDPRPRPRRERGRDDRFYAEVARDYLATIAGGSRRPIADMAAARGEKVSRVRDMVHEARERGLLLPGTPGKHGGKLLARAETLLNERSAK